MKPSIFLPRSESKLVFILVMTCYTWTTSSLVSVLVRAFHVAPPPIGLFANSRGEPTAKVIDLVFLAPLVESLILLTVIEIVRRLRAPASVQVAVAALVIGLLHSPSWWPRAFIVAPGFAIQGCAYLHWRAASRKAGYAVVASVHALHNLIPAISVFAYGMWHA